MSKETIIKLLREKGKTTGHIATALGVSYDAVYQTMDAKSTGSRRIRLFIAKTLGKSPSCIWAGEIKSQTLLVDDFEYMHGDK